MGMKKKYLSLLPPQTKAFFLFSLCANLNCFVSSKFSSFTPSNVNNVRERHNRLVSRRSTRLVFRQKIHGKIWKPIKVTFFSPFHFLGLLHMPFKSMLCRCSASYYCYRCCCCFNQLDWFFRGFDLVGMIYTLWLCFSIQTPPFFWQNNSNTPLL